MTAPDELKTLFPGRDIQVGNETLHIAPFFFRQTFQAIKLLKPIADILNASGILQFRQAGGQVTFALADDWPMRLPEIMADSGDVLFPFLAFALKKPIEWFDTLPTDDGIALVQAIFEENASFFRSRIMPLLQRAGVLNPKANPGEPSSPVSSTPDTTEAK